MPKILIILLAAVLALILLVWTISSIANMLFDKNIEKEVQGFFEEIPVQETSAISQKDIEKLPPIVQKWLVNAQVTGKDKIHTVRLKQKAELRLEPDKAWMPAEAEQYFSVDKPGFIWKARIKAAPLVNIAGRDKYYEGEGHMLIKLLSFITVADARGAEVNQGTLLRYLAETMWFPSAALSDYIQWEELDAHSAKATMSYGGVTASGVFSFNDKGEVVSFVAERYMESKGTFSLQTWMVLIKETRAFNGIRIPTKGELVWKLKSGDFNWFRFEIIDIEYNKRSVY